MAKGCGAAAAHGEALLSPSGERRPKRARDERDTRKCDQCRQWTPSEEGTSYGPRAWYCARCCARWERQQDADGAGPPAVAASFDLAAYKQLWLRLVEDEWSEEQRVVLDRLQNWSLKKLVAKGFCVNQLAARAHGSFFGKAKVVFSRPDLGRHQFVSGDEVIVSRHNPLTEAHTWKGEVIELGAQRIAIAASDDPPRDLSSGVWRLDRGANKTAYERSKAALGHVCGAKFRAPALRDLVLGEDVARIAPGAAALPPASGSLDSKGAAQLNASQCAAIAAVASKNLGLIQGPPGTGKTTTTCHLIRALLQSGKKPRILVAADSNVAVDQLLEGLLKVGLANVLRVGFPSHVATALRDRTLLVQTERHPRFAEVEGTREKLARTKGDLYAGRLKGKGKGLAHRDIQLCVRDLRRLEQEITGELIGGADVVCSTLIGCGSDALLQSSFDVVVIDEATQATEPRSLVALQKCLQQLVLVGDQRQLPPVVLCEEAGREGLSVSLFERLLKSRLFEGALALNMLTVQYRMHPLIREWPGERFYAGRLVDGPCCESQRLPGPCWLAGAVSFLDTSVDLPSRCKQYNMGAAPHEQQHGEGGSKSNELEAELVRMALDSLLPQVEARGVGVISFYAAQVSEVKRNLEQHGGWADEWEAPGMKRYAGVEVKTVDGYQGREKDVIILSCVRTAGLGFLADERRLNVAITRARRALVVIGHGETLRINPTWASWLCFVEARGLRLT